MDVRPDEDDVSLARLSLRVLDIHAVAVIAGVRPGLRHRDSLVEQEQSGRLHLSTPIRPADGAAGRGCQSVGGTIPEALV